MNGSFDATKTDTNKNGAVRTGPKILSSEIQSARKILLSGNQP